MYEVRTTTSHDCRFSSEGCPSARAVSVFYISTLPTDSLTQSLSYSQLILSPATISTRWF